MEAAAKTMKAVILSEFGQQLQVQEIPIPKPASGQVLIRMEASPINPSDLAFLHGHYHSKKKMPTTPGFEGSGYVVESGGGIMGWKLKGSRVAVAASDELTGCWAEYMIADANRCFPLDNSLTYEQGACTFVNPLTVMAMLEICNKKKFKAVVHGAAASALGRMMHRYFQTNGVTVINIVRRKEQVELLEKQGAKLVLNQSEEDFEEKLKKLSQEHNALCFFDPVGGEFTGKVLKNMPNNSVAYVYGALSGKGCVIDPIDLIFRGKKVKGFWLTKFLGEKGLLGKAKMMFSLKGLLKNSLATTVSKEFSLNEINEAVEFYKKNMSEGKVLIKPNKAVAELKEETKGSAETKDEKNENEKAKEVVEETKENENKE